MRHKSNATLNALIKLKIIFRYFLGVVCWFIITKVCFIDRFSLELENYFSKIKPSYHYESTLKKLRSFQLFSVDYAGNIEVLRLIKWILSKKLLHSVTNYYCDNKIICTA